MRFFYLYLVKLNLPFQSYICYTMVFKMMLLRNQRGNRLGLEISQRFVLRFLSIV